jgi:hypothetical protein
MTAGVFIQLFRADKETPLREAVRRVTAGEVHATTCVRVLELFKRVRTAPLCYWVDEEVLSTFERVPRLEQGPCVVRQGLATADDFRFLRASWELPAEARVKDSSTWLPFAKGGRYSPFYADIYLAVKWEYDGREIRFYGDSSGAKPKSRPQNTSFFLRPGITWPLRTNGLSFRCLPRGCAFGHKGPVVFVEGNLASRLLELCAVLNSDLCEELVSAQLARVELARSYEVGIIQDTPVPNSGEPELVNLALKAWQAQRLLDTANMTSHAFRRPALAAASGSVSAAAADWAARVAESADTLSSLRAEISRLVARLYGVHESRGCRAETSAAAEGAGGIHPEKAGGNDECEELDNVAEEVSSQGCVAELFDYAVGALYGRWDLTHGDTRDGEPDVETPFLPLPVCAPGMLQGNDGLPLAPKVGKEARQGGRYPIDVAWDGILVDDREHMWDIERGVRAVLAVLWGDQSDVLEEEACNLIGVSSLRHWFRRPAGFFANHLKRHSRSRRQAPIYWPLSTQSGDYTLWIYYHRLNDQTLHKCLADFLDPKIKEVEKELGKLTGKDSGRAADLRDFLNELKDLRDEIERVIKLPWKPNLNDGVLITASPLWKLFRLSKWQKDLKSCWEELEKGDYDWAHLAYTIWTERLEKVCEKDRSIAIAHGLEHLCKVEPPKPKNPRGKKASS